MEFFQPIKHQLNLVQNLFNPWGKNTNIVLIKQQGDKLLVP